MHKNNLNESPDKKNTIFKLILIVVNAITIIVILNMELKKGSLADFGQAVRILSENYIWLLVCIGLIVLKVLADSICYMILIKETTGEARFWLSLKIALIGKYGDGVTPMATGGQPFQIYFLYKYNIDLSQSASIPLTRIVVRVIGYDIVMLIFFIFFPQEGSSVIKTIAYVGIGINMLLPITIIMFTFKINWARKLTLWGLKLAHKLKLVKDIDKERDYWIKKVDDMLYSIKYFNSHPFIFFSILILSMVDFLCLASIPFFVHKAFGGGGFTWIFVATSTMYVISSAMMMPTPGTAGMAEASFYAIFARVITGGMIFYGIITWRFITFYSFMIIGIFLLIYESFFKKKAMIDLIDERKGRTTNRQRESAPPS